MRRLTPQKIDDAKYYEVVWAKENEARNNHHFDGVRMRALLEPVRKGNRVADVGAGVFGAAEYAVRFLDTGASFTAFDQSYTAKGIVNERAPELEYVLCDCESIPVPDQTFDVVMCGELIEHMEKPENLVKELARITKKGGYITLSTVDTNCEQARARQYPEHVFEFTPEDLVNFFKPYGEAEYKLVGNYHYLKCQRS